MTENSITACIFKVSDGDEEAFEKIFNKYREQLVRLAARTLAMPNHLAESEGAVDSAFRSLFSGIRAAKFPNLGNRLELWKILATLTIRKAIAQNRHYFRGRGENGRVERGKKMEAFVGREPGPQELVMLNEQREEMLERLGDETLKEIANLYLSGATSRDIAKSLRRNQRTIQRKLALIRSVWKEHLGDGC